MSRSKFTFWVESVRVCVRGLCFMGGMGKEGVCWCAWAGSLLVNESKTTK